MNGEHEGGDYVYGDWEHDGAVVLGRDVVQSLKVSELKTGVTKTPHLGLSLTCKAPALEEMILAAFFKARLDFSSPLLAQLWAPPFKLQQVALCPTYVVVGAGDYSIPKRYLLEIQLFLTYYYIICMLMGLLGTSFELCQRSGD